MSGAQLRGSTGSPERIPGTPRKAPASRRCSPECAGTVSDPHGTARSSDLRAARFAKQKRTTGRRLPGTTAATALPTVAWSAHLCSSAFSIPGAHRPCTTTCQILRAPRRFYVGQAGSLRPIAGALWARPGERSSPARETIRPPAARNILRGWVAALLPCGAGWQPAAPPKGHPQSARRAKLALPRLTNRRRELRASHLVWLPLCCSAGRVGNRPTTAAGCPPPWAHAPQRRRRTPGADPPAVGPHYGHRLAGKKIEGPGGPSPGCRIGNGVRPSRRSRLADPWAPA